VGKSSLLNKLIGIDRAVVSDRAGTTRDASNYSLEHNEKKITFYDTAGVRKRGKVGKSDEGYRPGQIERYSVLRSLRAIEKSSIVLLLVDASEGITAQDLHVLGYALDAKKSVILVINKWDKVEEGDMQEYLGTVSRKIPFLSYAPIIFVSAKTGKNVHKIFDLILETHKSRFIRIPTSELNSRLHEEILKKSPPAQRNILPNIKYITQTEVDPPTFVFFSNHPELIHFSYVRFLENRIREHWNFEGTPINISFRKKN
jgi:GTP-binding protein